MTFKYVPTTKEDAQTAETKITLVDRDYMIYEMLRDILNQLKKRPKG